MSTTNTTSSNRTQNVRAKVIYANYEIAKQALLQGQSIRMPSAANADVSVLAAKAIGPIQFTPDEIAAVLESTSIFPPNSSTAPGPVTGLVGISGNGEVLLRWTAPSNNGGSPITSYTVTWNDSSGVAGSVSVPTTSYRILNLSNDTTYTFIVTVVARNAIGPSSIVSSSLTLTPLILGYYVSTLPGEFDFGDYGAGVAVDANGTLYVTDNNNNRISKIQGTSVTTYAELENPASIAIDTSGILYVGDEFYTIYRIGTNGQVTTIAGGTDGSDDGIGTNAKFEYPYGIAVDGSGTVYVADCINETIRKIRVSDAYVSTYAGKVGNSGSDDGFGTNAQFDFEDYGAGVAVDANGILYVTDTDNELIRRIGTDGYVSTIAGQVGNSGSDDGFGTNAQFNFGDYSRGITVDKNGILYVADTENNLIRRIGTDGYVSTIAGQVSSGSDDGFGTNAQFDYPTGIAVDRFGNLYIGDLYNNTIRKMTPITAASLPLPVTDLVGTPSSGQVELTWTALFDPASTLESYTVTWSPLSMDGSGSRDLSGTTLATTTTIEGLTNETVYTFSVVATNSVGVGLQPVSVTLAASILEIPNFTNVARIIQYQGSVYYQILSNTTLTIESSVNIEYFMIGGGGGGGGLGGGGGAGGTLSGICNLTPGQYPIVIGSGGGGGVYGGGGAAAGNDSTFNMFTAFGGGAAGGIVIGGNVADAGTAGGSGGGGGGGGGGGSTAGGTGGSQGNNGGGGAYYYNGGGGGGAGGAGTDASAGGGGAGGIGMSYAGILLGGGGGGGGSTAGATAGGTGGGGAGNGGYGSPNTGGGGGGGLGASDGGAGGSGTVIIKII